MEITNISGNSAQGYDNTPPAQNKPFQLRGAQGELQRNVQRLNPFKPNNGNPRGANNMPNYQDTLDQGGKPGPGGYKPAPQGQPPLPQTLESMFPNLPPQFMDGDMEANAIRQYNLMNRRDRFDPGYGIIPMDAGQTEGVNPYESMYTTDGRIRFDQLLQGRGAPPFGGGRPTPPLPQGNSGSGGAPEWGSNPAFDEWNMGQVRDMRARSPEEATREREEAWQEWQRMQGGGTRPQGMGYVPNPSQGYWDQGQNPQWGRYVPPMMRDYRNPTDWYYQGGYNYNLPGAGGRFPTYGGFLNPPRPNFTYPNIPYWGG